MTSATTRLDLDGAVEHPVFLGAAGDAVFACLHTPAGAARGLVVLCSPVGAEWKYDYRREVLLARALAARGVAAVRFHYLGTGNSDDGPLDFPRMVADAARVETWAAGRTGLGATAWFGARLGALVAARAGAGTPLVVWGAPPSGATYFRELFRAAQASLLTAGGTGGPRADLEAGRPADVSGYTLPVELYRSVLPLTFAAELGRPPRRVRLVDFAEDDLARRRLAEHTAALRLAGFAVTDAHLTGESTWWLDHDGWAAEEGRASVRALLADTVSWLLATTPVGAS